MRPGRTFVVTAIGVLTPLLILAGLILHERPYADPATEGSVQVGVIDHRDWVPAVDRELSDGDIKWIKQQMETAAANAAKSGMVVFRESQVWSAPSFTAILPGDFGTQTLESYLGGSDQ